MGKGKKYIIELLDDCQSEFKGIMVFGLTQEKQISVELIPEEGLRPYTEPDLEQVKADAYNDGYKAGREAEKVRQKIRQPDLEQVRKDGYENGYENGFIAGHLKAEKSGQSFYEDGYQRGMADANRDGEYNADDGWYVMQKISLLPNPIKTELFGTAETAVILQDNSFKDALDKLTEYEQEKEAFHVGDEFENESGKRFVILKMDCDEIDRYIDEEGKTYCMTIKYRVMRKTGRHFPEIAAVLQKMKEGK